ncbi:hypothetical protein [Nitratireductor sp. StC3]|uniref:hypothetical protein n=1 Tax=Nitratireductor sp. StC3 TaxID=2126741 RepID=UPI0011B226CC|nr:hypothetical protein [Nitratireductor sp. StC3]
MAYRTLITALPVVGALALPAAAQSTDPAWLDEITRAIAAEKQCEVAYFIAAREYELGGRQVFEARVQCVDGRQFDASRTGPDTDFTFEACAVRVC